MPTAFQRLYAAEILSSSVSLWVSSRVGTYKPVHAALMLLYRRQTELFIVMTMYNEDDELFLKTMNAYV